MIRHFVTSFASEVTETRMVNLSRKARVSPVSPPGTGFLFDFSTKETGDKTERNLKNLQRNDAMK